MYYGIELIVIREVKYEGSVSVKAYVYDRLYEILAWFDVGKFSLEFISGKSAGEAGTSHYTFIAPLDVIRFSIDVSTHHYMDLLANSFSPFFMKIADMEVLGNSVSPYHSP